MRPPFVALPRSQRGAQAVEFALVAVFFFTVLCGVIQMGWMMAEWNTATEATRWGARVAVVCGLDSAAVKARMRALFPRLKSDDDITVQYVPGGCDAGNCQQVTVSIARNTATATQMFVFTPLDVSVPPFSTTLPRESMQSAIDGVANPVCQ